MKVAIYARYSSDNQRDASIADQRRVCREFASRQRWTVVEEFTDHAISGATLLRSHRSLLTPGFYPKHGSATQLHPSAAEVHPGSSCQTEPASVTRYAIPNSSAIVPSGPSAVQS